MKSPIIGNKRVLNIINSMISSKKIPHAIILDGEDGLGKKTLATYIAKACVCDEEYPCMKCKACHLVDVGSHPDCESIIPDGKIIPVDTIRELRIEAFMTPLMANGRVFIIHHAHLMNEEAQNALLKVLEEPPKNVTFILLSSNSGLLLQTVRSRCITLSLSPVPLEREGAEIVAQLASVSVEDAFTHLTATDGNIGAAVASATDGENLTLALVNEIITYATVKDRLKILTALQPFSKDRRTVSQIVFGLKTAVANEIKKKAMKEYTSFTAERLNYCYDGLKDLEEKLEYNPNLPLIFCHIAALLTD